jgi:hypothetical protein
MKAKVVKFKTKFGLSVVVSDDGVWIHLEGLDGRTCLFHVENVMRDRGDLVAKAASEWCDAMRERAGSIEVTP